MSHLDLARLEPQARGAWTDAERAHVDGCPRCRIEARLLDGWFEDDGSALPEWSEVGPALDDLRSELSVSLASGIVDTVAVAELEGPAGAFPPPEERYDSLGTLGAGGMGEVFRVRDRALNRAVAMKIATGQARPGAQVRFVEEAQVAAQLQHPGVVPVHDLGRLPDGRAWFTMKEVDGITLGDAIDDVHDASEGAWRRGEAGWTFRRLVDAFRRVCETMGYAHSRGVCHRDLKPANIMLGAWGEVLVLDWGLAKVSGRAAVATARSGQDALRTQDGTVAGTPAYMPPEQARGDQEAVGPRSDVYALGAVLFAILSGRAPFGGGHALEVLAKVAAGEARPLVARSGPIPDELRDACARAMAPAPDDRFESAGALAAVIGDWLDGAHRRDRALEALAEAQAILPGADAQRAEAEALRRRASAASATLRSFDPVSAKVDAWALEDEATRREAEAALLEVRFTEGVRAALTHDPTLPEAHAALADHYRRRHERAEAAGDAEQARRVEVLLRAHDDGRYAGYLAGWGRLSLAADADGARATVIPWEVHQRRLRAAAPLVEVALPVRGEPLPMGSHRVVVTAPGRAPVTLPVAVARDRSVDRVRPGSDAPAPLHLPAAGELGPDDRYVPGGWFPSGGDPRTPSSLPSRRVWVDGFVVRAHPVTHREYLAFLDDLVAQGREDEASAHAPRERSSRPGSPGDLLVDRGPEGFTLRADAEGDSWELDWPAWMVSWHGARAYAAWEAARTGLPWRLPWELEWEKAARGVDGRAWPWGDFGDPTWACVHGHREGRPMPASVHAHPTDESPYGVRGLAGNVCDWVLDVFTEEGPALQDGLFVPPLLRLDEPRLPRCVKGGSWSNPILHGRGAFRDGRDADDRRWVIGFRLARSVSEPR